MDNAKQSFFEWVSIVNDLLGKVQPGWVICADHNRIVINLIPALFDCIG